LFFLDYTILENPLANRYVTKSPDSRIYWVVRKTVLLPPFLPFFFSLSLLAWHLLSTL